MSAKLLSLPDELLSDIYGYVVRELPPVGLGLFRDSTVARNHHATRFGHEVYEMYHDGTCNIARLQRIAEEAFFKRYEVQFHINWRLGGSGPKASDGLGNIHSFLNFDLKTSFVMRIESWLRSARRLYINIELLPDWHISRLKARDHKQSYDQFSKSMLERLPQMFKSFAALERITIETPDDCSGDEVRKACEAADISGVKFIYTGPPFPR